MEATKAFSARGPDNYLKAASAINQLGRGAGLVIAWLEEVPHVGNEQFGVTVAGYFHVTSAGMAGGYANRQLAGRLSCHRPFDRIKGYPAAMPVGW